MLTVLAIIICCAVIPVVVGIVAFLGRTRKDKKPANQEAIVAQPGENP